MNLNLEADVSACSKFVDALGDEVQASRIYHALTVNRWCKARDINCTTDEQAVQMLSLDKNDPLRCISIDADAAGWMFVRIIEHHYKIERDYYDWFAHYAIFAASTPETIQMFYDIGWVPA